MKSISLITNSTVETISLTIYLIRCDECSNISVELPCSYWIDRRVFSLIFWLKWIETRRIFNRLRAKLRFCEIKQTFNWIFTKDLRSKQTPKQHFRLFIEFEAMPTEWETNSIWIINEFDEKFEKIHIEIGLNFHIFVYLFDFNWLMGSMWWMPNSKVKIYFTYLKYFQLCR